MEISIKLDGRNSGETPKGFPIVIEANSSYQQKRWRTGYHSKKTEWNEKLCQPRTKHPDFYVLSDKITFLKERIATTLKENNHRPLSMMEAKQIIFRTESLFFYDSTIASFPEDYNGTSRFAVESFNVFSPGLKFNEINKKIVLDYRDDLLKKKRKPSGVDSYLRSLRAIWNRLSNEKNPFSSISVEIPDKINTVATLDDMRKLRSAKLKRKPVGNGGYFNYRNYWLLMFYLGGIDPEALAKLRYDENVQGNHIHFNRDKGRSKAACRTIISKQAFEILKQYNCKPYLVPIYKSANYNTFRSNFTERMKKLSIILELSTQLRPKGARYTFIDRAQQLLIDERITAQIVGHKRRTTTSLYSNDFPQKVQDEAHLKIVSI